MEELITFIKETIAEKKEVAIPITGTSMLPMLKEKRDQVILTSFIQKNLKKYDIILYKRVTGEYVLHRIIKCRKNSFDLCGDHQVEVEHLIQENQVIAVVKAVLKNGKTIPVSKYRLYAFFRVLFRPFRKFVYNLKKISKR